MQKTGEALEREIKKVDGLRRENNYYKNIVKGGLRAKEKDEKIDVPKPNQ